MQPGKAAANKFSSLIPASEANLIKRGQRDGPMLQRKLPTSSFPSDFYIVGLALTHRVDSMWLSALEKSDDGRMVELTPDGSVTN